MYTYTDFVTRKTKRTTGIFDGFTESAGPLNVRYAIFKNPKGVLLIPEYLLTKETRVAIAAANTPPLPPETTNEA